MLIPAAGLCLIAVLFSVRDDGGDGADPLQAPVMTTQTATQPDEFSPQLSASLFAAWAEKLDQPLETEVSLLVSDATTALKAVSQNFLPAPR